MPIYHTQLLNQLNFWAFSSISEELFLSKADTGDILLSRSKQDGIEFFGVTLARTFTSSHFDHVAIILRYGDSVKDLYFMEAVGSKGVRMVSWRNFRDQIGEFGIVEKVVTRKL